MMWSEESSFQSMPSLPGLLSMMDDRLVDCNLSLSEESAINVSCVLDEEGVVHQIWLMWMMDDEEGSERKTKVYFDFVLMGSWRGLVSVIRSW